MINRTIFLIPALLFQLCLFAQNEEAGNQSPDVIYERYEEAFLSQDIGQMMELYTGDAVLVTPDGSRFKGRDEIRSTYENAFNYYPAGLTFDTFSFVVEDKLVFHTYSIWNEGSGEKLVPFSAETILIEEGKIRYHTIAEYDPARDVQSPLALSLPENWTSQTSLLPRYFAPNTYEGIADYAFAPGMFEPNKEDHFTYAMVLWTPIDTDVSRQKLENDLETYFDGLAAVTMPGFNESNADIKVAQLFDSLAHRYSVPEDSLRAKVKLQPAAGDQKWEKVYNGTISIYEGLAAHEPIELQTKVRLQKCAVSGYRVIFMEVSRQPYSHELWNRLDEMARQWQCPEE